MSEFRFPKTTRGMSTAEIRIARVYDEAAGDDRADATTGRSTR